VHHELVAYGTDGSNKLDDKEIGLALQALEAVIWRLLGMPLNLPFRNFTTFRSYWIREGASGHGGWQARRDIVEELLDPFRQELTRQRRSIPQISEELIATLRDPAAIREQLGRLQRIAQSDPPLAIGTAKELVESTAKTVLRERGLQVDDKQDLRVLLKQAQEALGLHPATAQPGPDSTGAVKRILGGLTSIAAGLGELRNLYGTGHGPKGKRVGLRPRHAQLAWSHDRRQSGRHGPDDPPWPWPDVPMHRIGWSVQVRARWAERDEDQIARWREENWLVIERH